MANAAAGTLYQCVMQTEPAGYHPQLSESMTGHSTATGKQCVQIAWHRIHINVNGSNLHNFEHIDHSKEYGGSTDIQNFTVLIPIVFEKI